MDESRIERRFAQSFRRTVDLGGNKNCSLKRHFKGALREVVGYLDLLAGNHSERFVCPSVAKIVYYCTKFGSENSYSKTSIEKALAYLRKRHVISGRVVRFWNGAMREGFIVAPHINLTIRQGETKCVYVGMAAPFDCWHQLPTGEIFWVDPQDPNRHKRPEFYVKCTANCTVHCTDDSGNCTVHCTDRCTVTSSVQQYGSDSLQMSDETIDTS